MTASPEKAAPIPAEVLELAHELWAAAQLGPLEGITDGVDRVADLLADQAREEERITRADRASQEENPRPAKTGGLETAVLRQPQEERIREKDDDTRLSLDVEWEERIREDEREALALTDGELPALPHPALDGAFSAIQMRWYARTAVMADRARQRGDAA